MGIYKNWGQQKFNIDCCPQFFEVPPVAPDVNRFYWTILEKENPEIFSESGSYGFYRTVPDALVVAMQGLEPRTPRI